MMELTIVQILVAMNTWIVRIKVRMKTIFFFRVCGLLVCSAFLSGCVMGALEALWEADCNAKTRYQTPQERSYIVREVTIQGGAPDVMLAGELTMPKGAGPFPGIVLISGSELADRDSFILGHKPFLVLADYLTRRGYAVFRHDDRGYGESTGDSYTALDADFSADAAAAMKWLRTQNKIDVNRVGYIGHSQGGFKATLASQTENSDFMIMIVGGVESIGGLLLRQAYDIANAAGVSAEDLERQERDIRRIIEIIRSSETVEEARIFINEYGLKEGTGKKQSERVAEFYTSPWMFSEIKAPDDVYAEVDAEMATLMKAYDRPILAVYGGKDLIVSADFNAPRTEPLLTHDKSKVVVFPDMNHFMQLVLAEKKNRSIEEVCEIETTFDSEILHIIGKWLDEVTAKTQR